MAIIYPYSDSSKYSAGGIWDATTAGAIANNFPSLKLFVPCKQTEIGLGYLTDIANGVLLNKSSGTIAAGPDLFSVVPSQAVTSTTITGTLPVIGSKNCMLFAVGKFTTGGFSLGNASTTGTINVIQGQLAGLNDGTNTLNYAGSGGSAFTNDSTIRGFANTVTWAGNQINYEATATTTITTKASVATSSASPGTIAGGIATLGTNWACGSPVTALYGAALFVFNGALPSGLAGDVAWMTYQWSIGNKWISPRLKGIS